MRLFIAATFPREVLRDLNERVSRLRPKLPPASWVREETQHLTFAFLGEQQESLIEKIDAPLRTAVAVVPAFRATIRGCGFFPNTRHARVGWAGLDPEDPFVQVATRIRQVTAAQSIALDGEFRPHLTLMRLRESWPPASTELFCRSLESYASVEFAVKTATLFSSQLHPSGAVHTALREYPLGG